ncbi:MAG: exonuclease domain-containing protein [Anaerolineae bacterium]|nr:exonuclease domain-containing protein [Anaerolineae bacterium]MDW8100291.1 exonuclease domain-containing protein [Anaerolineae bacterium]
MSSPLSQLLHQSIDQVTFAVIDVEKTGLDPALVHRLCEIAVVRGADGQELATFSQRVNPERPVDPGARAVHRISDAELWAAPRFAEIAPAVRKLMEGAVLVAHHALFDLSFLAVEWRRLRWPAPATPVVDTLLLTRRWLRLPHNGLGFVANVMGIRAQNAHSALGDARITWQVLNALVRRLRGLGFTTLGDLINAQGGPIGWPSSEWEQLPAPLPQALQGRRRLWLRYQDEYGGYTERLVDPLDANHRYLIAYCHLRQAERVFRLDRILEMQIVEEFSDLRGIF